MKNIFKISILTSIIAFTFYSCKQDKTDPTPVVETGRVKLYFDTQVLLNDTLFQLALDTSGVTSGDSTTALGDNKYTTTLGTKITVNQVKYWVSNIVLTDEDNNTYAEPNSYHLIEYTPNTARGYLTITGVPVGEYTKIDFSIGVDSARNHDLTQKAGDLSENIGMSWSWSTGYIFFKMEGRFERADGKFGYYQYHIGNDANYKSLHFDFPEEEAVVTKTDMPTVHFKLNTLGVFGIAGGSGLTLIDVRANPVVMMNSTVMSGIADNYAKAFVLDHVHSIGHH